MATFHKEAEFEMNLLAPDIKAVVVDLLRAGILPAQTCYEFLHFLGKPENLRQDHILAERATGTKGEVVGVHLSGYKIGGPVKDAFVIIPDPMAATGSTVSATIDLYRARGDAPLKFIALHFIVTPEYLMRMKPYADDLEIFTLRVDRGLSEASVLGSKLGEFWEKERGLNDKQYIVPGAGGIGEILNNSFV